MSVTANAGVRVTPAAEDLKLAICRYCDHKTESSVLQNKAECIFGDSELQNNATHYELTFLAIWGEKISTVLREDCVSAVELKTNPFIRSCYIHGKGKETQMWWELIIFTVGFKVFNEIRWH